MDECFLNDVLGNKKQNKKTRRLAYIPSKEKKRINQELLKKKKKKKKRERGKKQEKYTASCGTEDSFALSENGFTASANNLSVQRQSEFCPW